MGLRKGINNLHTRSVNVHSMLVLCAHSVPGTVLGAECLRVAGPSPCWACGLAVGSDCGMGSCSQPIMKNQTNKGRNKAGEGSDFYKQTFSPRKTQQPSAHRDTLH